MSETSWNPPTGPPNGAPVRAADARREIEQAIDRARGRDRELRAEVVVLTTARVAAVDRLAATGEAADEARSLARSALRRANDSARDGQRADAAKWTGAARVFGLRLRDARQQMASLEQQVAAATQRAQRVYTALAENVGRLEAVVASRLPMLGGRKAARLQDAVNVAIAEISAPTADLVAQATEAARAASSAAAESSGAVAPVTEDDLETEVDLENADDILDELRDELGLPGPAGVPAATGDSGTGDARTGDAAEGWAAETATAGRPASRSPRTRAASRPAGPVPATRR